MTVFWKTDHVVTNTEIHFLPVDESHTHALSRDTKHLSLDGQVCFFRRLFSDDAKPRGCISWPVRPLRGINKTAWVPNWFWRQTWSTRWVVPGWVTHWWHSTAICVWMFALACLRLPTRPHRPPHPPPTRPPPIDSIRVITAVQKNCLKNQRRSNSLWN